MQAIVNATIGVQSRQEVPKNRQLLVILHQKYLYSLYGVTEAERGIVASANIFFVDCPIPCIEASWITVIYM